MPWNIALFFFVGFIYKEIYVISHIYFNDKAETNIQKLNSFFRKNYSDLLHDYNNMYGLSEEKQKLLLEFIIKFESDYKQIYIYDYGILIGISWFWEFQIKLWI